MAEPALRGVLAVAQTPFHDDESLDLDAYDRQIDRLFGNGADRVVIGMVSEVLKLTAAALLRYFWAILAAVDIPVIIQDASGYIGPSLSIDLQAKLWVEFGDRVMFKPEADPIGPRVTAMREATDGRGAIFEGTGGLHLIDTYRRGVVGTMPAGDLVWALAALWHALTAGDLDQT